MPLFILPIKELLLNMSAEMLPPATSLGALCTLPAPKPILSSDCPLVQKGEPITRKVNLLGIHS